MSEYTPINLGDILAQAGQIKAQQQRSQIGALQLSEAQKSQQDQQGIDSALVSNPNADLPTLIKAGGGMAGVKASTDVGAARTADLTNHYRQTYTAASQVANSDNPLATIQQVAPQFPQQYDSVHGQGSFAKIAQDPATLKQQAAQVAQDALAGLVDPDKQFQAHQTTIENHYKQEGPGGELARNQNTIAAENARAANANALTLRGQSITLRGQDLENSRGNKPQLVEVPNADGTVTKKWIVPGQVEGPTVGTSPPGAKLTETQGNAKAFGLRAQEANQSLESMISGPNAYNPTGLGAMKDAAAAGTSANWLASDAGQKYQNVAKAFIAPVLRKESGAAISESEWKSAKQLYIPIPGDSPTVLAQKVENRKNAIEGLRVQAGPTGLPELSQPADGSQAAPVTTRPDLANLQVQPGSAGTDSSQWGKRADGSEKGNGWLGVLRRPDGGVSSEISVGVNISGKETEIPLMVPSLTKAEVTTLLHSNPKDPNFFSSLPASIKQKAVTFARQRIAQGQSPFAGPQESPGAAQGTHPPAIQSLLDKYK